MTYGDKHPSKRILATNSNLLGGKNIGLGITGSVAAFLSPKIARELIRHGANVYPIISKAGLTMIGRDLMWWATGNEPITEITGDLEHIRMAGVMNDPLDLLLIAPCTTNTVAKMASGIADSSVTLISSSLFGKGVPILINPVAHEDLINSPPIKNAMDTLLQWGVEVIEPIREEGKAKVPEIDDIIFAVINRVTDKSLSGNNLIITAGPTREYIDNVRYVSNEASGRTGIELAQQCFLSGADTSLILGPTSLKPVTKIPVFHVVSSQDMADKVLGLLREKPGSIVILTSAMADFTPKEAEKGKIKSGSDLIIEFKPTTKLSDIIKSEFPKSKLILFKAEWDVDSTTLLKRAREKLEKCNAELIIANDLSEPNAGFQTQTNHVYILNKDAHIEVTSLKSELSQKIINLIHSKFKLK